MQFLSEPKLTRINDGTFTMSERETLKYSLANSLCSLKIFWDTELFGSGVAGLRCGSKNKCIESRSIDTSLSERFAFEVDESAVDVLSVTVSLSWP